MEMQFFVKPGTDDEWFNYWREQRWAFYKKHGVRMDKLRWHQHGPDELAHYAKTLTISNMNSRWALKSLRVYTTGRILT